MNLIEDECVICYDEISKDKIFIMIDHPGESGKYHVQCIEKWMNKSLNGILVQKPIEKLNLLFEDKKIAEMKVVVHENIKYDELDLCCTLF